MIGRHHIGLLGQALLLLGVVPLPPPREPENDMAAVEKVMQELAAAGISAAAVLDAAGSPPRFVETAQKCLSMQAALAAQGQPSVDVVYLLARYDDLFRRPLPTRPALHGFEGLNNPREGMPAPRRPYPAPTVRCTCGGAGICSEYCACELAAGRMAHPDGPCALGFEDRCKRCRRENRKHQRAQRGALRPQQAAARKSKAAKKARRGW